jgi:hypothetical protein
VYLISVTKLCSILHVQCWAILKFSSTISTVKKYCDIRYIVAYRDTIVWPINHLNVEVSMKYVRKSAVGYNNCNQDVDFNVRHALTPVSMPNFSRRNP